VTGLVVVTGMAFEARIAAGAQVEVLSGLGGAALAAALAVRLRQPCDGVISFGVAGGLDAALVPGAVLVAQRVAEPGAAGYATDARWSAALLAALPGAVAGTLAGVAQAAATVADKQALRRATGALAVDMESHIAARAAQAAAVPFAACRIVLDSAVRAVPPAALAAMGPDGRTRIAAMLLSLAAHPGQLPDLLRLARDAGAARTALRVTRVRLGERYALPAGLVHVMPG
jgi:hopanoid-associated phosphorylase